MIKLIILQAFKNSQKKIIKWHYYCNKYEFFIFHFQASKVVGQYLVMDGNKREFKQFMGQTCYANDKQANDAYKCVKEYTDNFM